MLDAPVLRVPVACIAADTAANFFADNGNLLDGIARAARTLDECLRVKSGGWLIKKSVLRFLSF